MRHLLIVILCALLLHTQVQAEELEIKLERASVVGAKYHITCTSNVVSTQTVTISDKARPAKESKTIHKLEGMVEILEVDGKGDATAMKITLTSLARMLVGESGYEELAIKGDVITAKTDKKTDQVGFELFGQPDGKLSDDAITALKLLTPMKANVEKQHLPTEGELFPSTVRAKVGDHWPVDTQVAVKSFSAKKENVTGRMKFVRESIQNEIPCVEFESQLAISGMTRFDKNLPAGAKLKSMSLNVDRTAILPKDNTLPILRVIEVNEIMLDMKITLPDNPQLELEVRGVTKQTFRYDRRDLK